MLQGWLIVALALAYIGLLFLVASYGDRSRVTRASSARLFIYPLSLAIYCTSWTFFGSVGLASRSGFDFLTIYIGPMLMLSLGFPLLIRIVRLAKSQNITSIADFIAARYGKSQTVAATVALIAIIGMIPYIALQLKAVSSSVSTILAEAAPEGIIQPLFGDLALFVALAMATFAVLFGTRHIDATEHQDGLMLAIATESVVKLVAFLSVGIFVTFVMFNGPIPLVMQALEQPRTAAVLTRAPQLASLCAMTMLSFFAIVLLPRQFHVTVVENHTESEIRRAAWLFPLYLVLINLFVLPIAMAGLLTFPAGHADSDMFVVALPFAANSELITLVAFIGGNGDGDRRNGRARHHGVERHRHTACTQAPRDACGRGGRCRRAVAGDTPRRHFRHLVSRLCLLPVGRRGAARSDRTVVVCRHRAVGAGFFRRLDLAARHLARRDCRHERWRPGLGLYAAAAEHVCRRHRQRANLGRWPLGHRFLAARSAVRPRHAASRTRHAVEPSREYRLLCRLFIGTTAKRY